MVRSVDLFLRKLKRKKQMKHEIKEGERGSLRSDLQEFSHIIMIIKLVFISSGNQRIITYLTPLFYPASTLIFHITICRPGRYLTDHRKNRITNSPTHHQKPSRLAEQTKRPLYDTLRNRKSSSEPCAMKRANLAYMAATASSQISNDECRLTEDVMLHEFLRV